MEETARFILNASSLTQQLKSLRHRFAASMERLPRKELLEARNSGLDVGTAASTQREQQRGSVTQIVAAAAGRTQQAMRCLEEYGKLIDVTFATEVEQLRYQCYDICSRLEQLCLGSRDRLNRLQNARLYCLMDTCASERKMLDRIRSLAAAGVDIIQLRESSVDDRTLWKRAAAGTHLARELGVLWIINDRADIAAAADADGVHVGQDELPVSQVRRIVGAEKLIGLSTHNIEQVRDAVRSTADYIGCGPVFPGTTKSFDEFPGCGFLQEIVSELNDVNGPPPTLAAFAIGGITPANAARVAAVGFGRVAVTSALSEGCESSNAAALRRCLQHVPLSTTKIP
ncbi:Thiamine-phosphate synthase [Allorhodopirellula heiligendammensis]|uniref:Thiamine-phosphate synthase n=2 Tax=Allorhodopirellula heiligendammensis TaxID=2714739 RepID=A0A5C6BJL6_9BACT|nr:Thiamine-phosphate synthase [Allorhodopirellula heiligendammensis]